MTKSMNFASFSAACLVGAQLASTARAHEPVSGDIADIFVQAAAATNESENATRTISQDGAALRPSVAFGKYCGNGTNLFVGGDQWRLTNYCYDVQPGDNPETIVFEYPEPLSGEPLVVRTVFSPDMTFRAYDARRADIGIGHCELDPQGLLCHTFVIHLFPYTSAENHLLITKNPSNGKDRLVVHGSGSYNGSKKGKSVWDVTMDRQ